MLRGSNSASQLLWGASNAKSVDITRKPVEDDTCAKCGEKDPDHMKEDCLKETRRANCRQNHPVYARSCEAYKKKEILQLKHKRNVSFLEARKIVGTYMGENIYVSFTWTEDTINQDHRYKAHVEKLIQLEPNDWPKFHDHLKNLHSYFKPNQDQSVQIKKKPVK